MSVTATPAVADAASAAAGAPPADEAAVRVLFAELLAAWGRGDGRAYAACFTADADYVAFDGSHTRGREAIDASHQQLFDTWLKGTRLVGQVTGVRFLSPDVALLHATGGTVKRGRSTPAPGRDSIQTLVATREGGVWRFAAFQNSRVRLIGRNAATALAWLLSDILWGVLGRGKGAARG